MRYLFLVLLYQAFSLNLSFAACRTELFFRSGYEYVSCRLIIGDSEQGRVYTEYLSSEVTEEECRAMCTSFAEFSIIDEGQNQHMNSAPVYSLSSADDYERLLWEEHVESMTHQRDPSLVLEPSCYTTVQKQEIGGSKGVTNDHCSICLENFENRMNQHQEVVRVNCNDRPENGHVFCKSCIEEAYQFQLLCPLCRGEIRKQSSVVLRRLPAKLVVP